MTRTSQALIKLAVVATFIGCKAGPNYHRPTIDTPASYKEALAPELSKEKSIADQQWASIFQDPTLQALVQEAIKNNLDLHIAAQRVLEAQAQLGIAHAQQLPTISGGGSYSALQIPQNVAGTNTNGTNKNSFFDGGGFSASAAWNLDFWGMYRRQSEAARAELLATEWAQRATQTTLVQQVAQSYFQLRSLDAQLQITQATIQARQDSLHLTQTLEQGGASSLADVRQAEQLLHAAQANLPQLRQQIAAEENALSILLGHNPGPIARGLDIAAQPHPDTPPTGLPAELLERRPDIQSTEAKLIAANARIGVARAQYLPQIALTSQGGSASNQLTAIFTSPNAYWYAAGSLTQPIFDGGRIRANYHLSQAQEKEMLLEYQKTILGALRDVSNSLSAYRETSNRRTEETAQVASATDAVRLARLRYAGGNTGYLEVLTTDTNLYTAQLSLVQAQQQEAESLVQLYAALGGGWQ